MPIPGALSFDEFKRVVTDLASRLPLGTTETQFRQYVEQELAPRYGGPLGQEVLQADQMTGKGAFADLGEVFTPHRQGMTAPLAGKDVGGVSGLPSLTDIPEPTPVDVTLPAMALRTVPAVAGNVLGGIGGALTAPVTGPGALPAAAAGARLGGFAGGALGEYLAQKLEQSGGQREQVSPGMVVGGGVIGGFVPGALKAGPTIGRTLAAGALKRAEGGAAIGALDALGRMAFEEKDRKPTFPQLLLQTGMGFGLGGLMGVGESAVLARKASQAAARMAAQAAATKAAQAKAAEEARLAIEAAKAAADAKLFTELPRRPAPEPNFPEVPSPMTRILVQSPPPTPPPGTPAAAMAALVPSQLQGHPITSGEATFNALIPERFKPTGASTVALKGGALVGTEKGRMVPGPIAGFALPRMLTTIGGGGVGGVVGGTIGDTPEERLRNAAIYGGAGAFLGYGLGRGRTPVALPMPNLPKQAAIEAAEQAALALQKERPPLAQRASAKVSNWHSVIDDFLAQTQDGVNRLPAAANPEKTLDIHIAGLPARIEAAKIVLQNTQKKAQAAGIEPHLRRYLRLMGFEHGWDTEVEHLQAARNALATASSQSATDSAQKEIDTILEKIANAEVLPEHYTPTTIAQDRTTLLASLPSKQAQGVQQFGQQVFDLNYEALQMLGDSGLVSQQLVARVGARKDNYIPLTRVLNTFGEFHPQPNALSVSGAGVHGMALKGSELPTVDPFRASFDRYQSAVKLVARNEAAKSITNLPTVNPVFTPTIRPLNASQAPRFNEGVISSMTDGKATRYAVPGTLADAMKFIDMAGTSMSGTEIGKFLGFFRNLLQYTTTVASPVFALVNPIKDMQDTAILGKIPLQQWPSFIREYGKSIGAILREEPAYLDFLRSGRAYAGMQKHISPESFTAYGPDQLNRVQKLMLPVTHLANAFEEAPKMAGGTVLDRLGMDPTEVTSTVRRYVGSPDFGRFGTMSRSANLLVNFANAQVQGITRNYARAKESPGTLAIGLGTVLALAGLQNAWNDQFVDGDGLKSIDRLAKNDKTNYFTLIMPQTYDDHGLQRHKARKLALGHTAKMFYNLSQGVWEALKGNPAATENAAANFISSQLPGNITLDPKHPVESLGSGALSSLNPFLSVTPSLIANYNPQTRNAIVPQFMANVRPALQETRETSPTISALTKGYNAMVPRMLEVSPMRPEFVYRTTLGGLGEMGLSAVDEIIRAAQQRKAPNPTTPIITPFTRRFTGSNVDQRLRDATEQLYNLYAEATQANTTKNFQLARTPKAQIPSILTSLTPREKLLIGAYPALSTLVGELGAVRTQRERLYQEHPPDLEQQLDRLIKIERTIIPRVVDTLSKLGLS